MTSPVQTGPSSQHSHWHLWFAETIRLVVAPLMSLSAGYLTAGFFLNGHYTWPDSSRVLALTLTLCVLAYEFVFKEQRATAAAHDPGRPLRSVIYSCVLPYVFGWVVVLVLVSLAP